MPDCIYVDLRTGTCRPLELADVLDFGAGAVGYCWDKGRKVYRPRTEYDRPLWQWLAEARGNASRIDIHAQLRLEQHDALRLWHWDAARGRFVLEQWSMPP